jgi:hypothetical protein
MQSEDMQSHASVGAARRQVLCPGALVVKHFELAPFNGRRD